MFSTNGAFVYVFDQYIYVYCLNLFPSFAGASILIISWEI